MRVFNPANFNQEVTFFIREWTKLLSEDKFDEACSQLDIPEDKEKNIVWNGNVLKGVFLDYCWHERMPLINNPYLMDLQKERIDLYEYNDGTGCAVDYDIPTDNNWGDLTAQFYFIKHTDNLFYVYLNDIHVL